MRNLFYFLIGLFLLISCGQSSNKSADQKDNKIQLKETNISLASLYKITSEKENINLEFNINKCNIVIELNEKISKENLTLIAYNLRKTRTKYDKLWISYYLKEMNDIAWAITNFTPDLQVEIIGTTSREETKIKENSNNVKGKIIGKFYEEEYSSAAFTIYENNGKTIIKRTTKNGSTSEYEMKKTKVKSGIRLDYEDGSHAGEYFILTESNILEFYDEEGDKFTVATRIN